MTQDSNAKTQGSKDAKPERRLIIAGISRGKMRGSRLYVAYQRVRKLAIPKQFLTNTLFRPAPDPAEPLVYIRDKNEHLFTRTGLLLFALCFSCLFALSSFAQDKWHTLQSAVSANANGDTLRGTIFTQADDKVMHACVLVVTSSGSMSATINFEKTIMADDSAWTTAVGVDQSDSTHYGATVTTVGTYTIFCPGAQQVRGRISNWVSGAITIKACVVPGSVSKLQPPLGAGDLPSGIDAAKIANGSVSNTEYQYLDGVTSAIQPQLNAKQASLGYTAENQANKDTDVNLAANSDVKYASQKAIKSYVDTGLAGKQAAGSYVTGTLTPGTVPVATGPSALGNGRIADDGTTIKAETGIPGFFKAGAVADGLTRLEIDTDNGMAGFYSSNFEVPNGVIVTGGGLYPNIEGVGTIGQVQDPFASIYIGSAALVTTHITTSATGVQTANFPDASGNVLFDSLFNLSKTVIAPGNSGAQTINQYSGAVNFAAAATSLVVTNSLVDANSVVTCTVGTNDTTMKSVACVVASSSFTIFPNAAPTAETRVYFRVSN